jgi:hypothetical protein
MAQLERYRSIIGGFCDDIGLSTNERYPSRKPFRGIPSAASLTPLQFQVDAARCHLSLGSTVVVVSLWKPDLDMGSAVKSLVDSYSASTAIPTADLNGEIPTFFHSPLLSIPLDLPVTRGRHSSVSPDPTPTLVLVLRTRRLAGYRIE